MFNLLSDLRINIKDIKKYNSIIKYINENENKN